MLPFENLSSDKENAFFAQGIQDEIITTLSRISGLRVISRTSTAHYNSAPENLPEIARQLRVSHVLEGSVQKAGDRVHINVQLIQADDDAHLWAQSYDRQLTDIFGVEAEVAKSIADSLKPLFPRRKKRAWAKPNPRPTPTPTCSICAAAITRRGLTTCCRIFRSAINLYDQAIKLDPKFALAHARLSATASLVTTSTNQPRRGSKRAHVGSIGIAATPTQPRRRAPRAGSVSLLHRRRLRRALRELRLRRRRFPTTVTLASTSAAVERRRWTFDAGARCLPTRAKQIDPRNSVMLYDASQTYFRSARLAHCGRANGSRARALP